MNSIPIYSIIAHSGVGKTTLIEKLIPELKKRGYRVAAIKHDAHEFNIDRPGKDSFRMTQAGADVTVIASDTHAAVMENRPVDIGRLISDIKDVDIILTEGYKHGKWPKIGVCRKEPGKPLPDIEGGYLAVMSNAPLEQVTAVIPLDDIRGLADLIEQDMGASRLPHYY